MSILLALHARLCVGAIAVLLRLAVALDSHRRWLRQTSKRLRGSLRRVLKGWLLRHGLLPFEPIRRCRRAWNRTPDHVEEKVVRLHVDQPDLGIGQLRFLAMRVIGFDAARETFRQILMRRRDLVTTFEQAKRKRPRRISVSGPRELWGADLTLVWVLGFWPVWLLGVVDYHGSRLVALERLAWPTAAEVARGLNAAFVREGAPAKLLTDRGPVFRAAEVQGVLRSRCVKHALTRPAHPWTNGRIERLFRTFKETAFGRIWLFGSVAQVDRFSADFRTFYNRDRPHSAWSGRTPDEVYFGWPVQRQPIERVAHFDDLMPWWRFG